MKARFIPLLLVPALGLSPSGESSEFFGLLHSGIVPADVPQVWVGGLTPNGLVSGGLSADGRVLVGTYTLPYDEQRPPSPIIDYPVLTEAFRWSLESGFEAVRLDGFPAGTFDRGNNISEDGRSLLVRGGLPSADRPGLFQAPRSFLWSVEDGLTDFGTTIEEGVTQVARATDLSADGSVVVGSFGNQAFRWTVDTGIELLGDLPGGAFRSLANGVSRDGSVIAGTGTAVSDAGSQAFRWTEETGIVGLGYLDSRTQTTATTISPSGETVIGFAYGFSEPEIAFRWTEQDGMQAIGPGIPTAIADDGTIVGHSYGEGPAFVWSESRGLRTLEDVLSRDFGLGGRIEGWSLGGIWNISADGTTLVGVGRNPAGELDAWMARRLRGDYNGDSFVDQADLDLVLLNWGAGADSVPESWTTNPPNGIIDQAELDGVLLHWGQTTRMTSPVAVPEPSAAAMLLIGLIGVLTLSYRETPHAPIRVAGRSRASADASPTSPTAAPA